MAFTRVIHCYVLVLSTESVTPSQESGLDMAPVLVSDIISEIIKHIIKQHIEFDTSEMY